MNLPETSHLSRRNLLRTIGLGATALGAGIVGRPSLADVATAKPSSPKLRNPWIYSFRIGEIEAWSISDGFLVFNQGLDLMYPESERSSMKALLEANREPTDIIPLYVNVLVLRKGSEVMLFDAGFGLVKNELRGWLLEGLAAIGIEPSQVTAGFLSHAHGDHLNGFVNPDDKPMFSNAVIYATPEEFSFWRQKEHDFSKSKRPPSWIPGMIRTAQEKFEILAPQIETAKVGSELFDGLVTIVDGFGHTPGHAVFRIQSQGESMWHIVDLTHSHLLMFHDPAWSIGLDHTPELAVSARRRIFAQAAEERARCFGFHVPWPGIGMIAQKGAGYAWIPERIWWQ